MSGPEPGGQPREENPAGNAGVPVHSHERCAVTTASEISSVSEVVRGLGRGYELHRVCFPAEVKDEVYRLYHGTS